MNIGGSEFLIIAVLALLLFGPSLLAFWFGYMLGQRKGEDGGKTPDAETESPRAESMPSAPETAGPADEESASDE